MKLNINDHEHDVDVDLDTPLLWVLRDHLGLTGTKFGCGVAQCGACTVHVNGKPRRACVTPVSVLGDAKITTIEGLSGDIAEAVRRAWLEIDVPQCGYCQAGQIMSAAYLLSKVSAPTDTDIDHAMSGNICRCATYMRIRSAIKKAASEVK